MAQDFALEPPPMPPGVDSGRPCDRYNDNTIKRRAIPAAVRRAVATRYGATAGVENHIARCQYCPATGVIYWPNLYGGKPGSWVHFQDLSLDHVHPYSKGGSNYDPDNFVLACKRCNSSKSDRLPGTWAGVGL